MCRSMYDAKEAASETTASPEHCCKNCHSNKEVRSHHSHSPWATLVPVEMRIDHKTLSLVYSCMNGTAPDYFRKLISCYLPVRHLRFSTQSRLRISDVDQGNNNNNKNTLESEYLPMLHPNCGTVCTLPWDSIIQRKLLQTWLWHPVWCGNTSSLRCRGVC